MSIKAKLIKAWYFIYNNTIRHIVVWNDYRKTIKNTWIVSYHQKSGENGFNNYKFIIAENHEIASKKADIYFNDFYGEHTVKTGRYWTTPWDYPVLYITDICKVRSINHIMSVIGKIQ